MVLKQTRRVTAEETPEGEQKEQVYTEGGIKMAPGNWSGLASSKLKGNMEVGRRIFKRLQGSLRALRQRPCHLQSEAALGTVQRLESREVQGETQPGA